MLAALALTGAAHAAPPANDAFDSPRALTTGVAVTGTTEEASAEAFEMQQSFFYWGRRSVWFTWTAPSDGLLRLDACASDFPTVVSLFADAAERTELWKSRIASNTEGCFLEGPAATARSTSILFARVQAGSTYRILLDSSQYDSGNDYRLVADLLTTTGPPPANDEIDGAPVLTGTSVGVTGDTTAATSGWDEPPSTGSRSVHWRWTSPVDGRVAFDTCDSGFDTVIAVKRRREGDWQQMAPELRGCGDDRARLETPASAGEEFLITVAGQRGAAGAVDLDIEAWDDLTPPETTITHGPASVWGRRIADVFWEVEDESSTTSECSFDGGDWYACSYNPLPTLTEGAHVLLVRSRDWFGNVEPDPAKLEFTVVIPQAANDHFADAIVMQPGVPVSVNNGHATFEPGEIGHYSWARQYGFEAHHSVWFRFTPTADGVAKVDWCASGVDLTMSAYTGPAIGSLTLAGGASGGCWDTFYVDPGVTYSVALDGESTNETYGTGPITVAIDFPTAAETSQEEKPPGDDDKPAGEEGTAGEEETIRDTSTAPEPPPDGGPVLPPGADPPLVSLVSPPAPPPEAPRLQLGPTGTVAGGVVHVDAVVPGGGMAFASLRRAAGDGVLGTSTSYFRESGRARVRIPLRPAWARRLARRSAIRAKVTLRFSTTAGRQLPTLSRLVTLRRTR